MINFVSANLFVSDVGVIYEKRVLDEYGIFNKRVNLIIYLNNETDHDNLILELLEKNVVDIVTRNISKSKFSAKVNKKIFLELIEDERIRSIYYNAPIFLSATRNLKSIFYFTGILFFIFIIWIYMLHKK